MIRGRPTQRMDLPLNLNGFATVASTQTIIITGAGAGIGRALTVGLAQQDTHLVAIGRGRAGLGETINLCAGRGSIESHVADVRDAGALELIFARLVKERGTVDLLINSAAVYPRQTLSETTPTDWAAGVETNLGGVVYGCRAAIRTFPTDHPALILNVGSFAYLAPNPGSTLYCTTKAAVSAFTRAIAMELATLGSPIIVNEWIPGTYRTQMSGNTGDDPALALGRLMAVRHQSSLGPGGRSFEEDREVLPLRSLRSRVKARLRALLPSRRS